MILPSVLIAMRSRSGAANGWRSMKPIAEGLRRRPSRIANGARGSPPPCLGLGICLPYRPSRLSSGAPVPDEPTDSFLPSGKVMSRPFARFAPSFAWKPSTMISMP